MMIKYFAVTFLCTISVFSQDLEDTIKTIPSELKQELLLNGVTLRYPKSWKDIVLLPPSTFTKEIQQIFHELRPNIIAEQLYLIRKTLSEEDILYLYNTLRRIREMSFVNYYNARKDTVHELFFESRTVKDPQSLHSIPDILVDTIPAEDSLWVLQDMPPFGNVLSQYHYFFDGQAFLVTSSNKDELFYRDNRLVRSEKMISIILCIPADGYVLVYGLGGIKAFTAFGLLNKRINSAFAGRITGLLDWYYNTHLLQVAAP